MVRTRRTAAAKAAKKLKLSKVLKIKKTLEDSKRGKQRRKRELEGESRALGIKEEPSESEVCMVVGREPSTASCTHALSSLPGDKAVPPSVTSTEPPTKVLQIFPPAILESPMMIKIPTGAEYVMLMPSESEPAPTSTPTPIRIPTPARIPAPVAVPFQPTVFVQQQPQLIPLLLPPLPQIGPIRAKSKNNIVDFIMPTLPSPIAPLQLQPLILFPPNNFTSSSAAPGLPLLLPPTIVPTTELAPISFRQNNAILPTTLPSLTFDARNPAKQANAVDPKSPALSSVETTMPSKEVSPVDPKSPALSSAETTMPSKEANAVDPKSPALSSVETTMPSKEVNPVDPKAPALSTVETTMPSKQANGDVMERAIDWYERQRVFRISGLEKLKRVGLSLPTMGPEHQKIKQLPPELSKHLSAIECKELVRLMNKRTKCRYYNRKYSGKNALAKDEMAVRRQQQREYYRKLSREKKVEYCQKAYLRNKRRLLEAAKQCKEEKSTSDSNNHSSPKHLSSIDSATDDMSQDSIMSSSSSTVFSSDEEDESNQPLTTTTSSSKADDNTNDDDIKFNASTSFSAISS